MRKMYDHRNVRLKPIHAEDEPIPGEIEARFTKDKSAQELFQVYVETKESRIPTAVSPKMLKEACEAILVSINKAIIDGVRREWANPFIARAA